MWPFNKKLDVVDSGFARLEAKIDEVVKREQDAQQRLVKLLADLNAVNAEFAKAKTQIRAQTEADLYFISAKIMRDILEYGKPKSDDVDRQATLSTLRMQQAAQAAPIAGLGYAGSLAGFGLGNLSGGR